MTSPTPRRRLPGWATNPVVWIFLVVAVPLAVAVVISPFLRRRLTTVVIEDCRTRYARAATAEDSAAADRHEPLRSRGRKPEHPLTCGELRRQGRLR